MKVRHLVDKDRNGCLILLKQIELMMQGRGCDWSELRKSYLSNNDKELPMF